jgi:hypothetical protein
LKCFLFVIFLHHKIRALFVRINRSMADKKHP